MITQEEFEDLWNSVYYDREIEKFKRVRNDGLTKDTN